MERILTTTCVFSVHMLRTQHVLFLLHKMHKSKLCNKLVISMNKSYLRIQIKTIAKLSVYLTQTEIVDVLLMFLYSKLNNS